MRQTVNGNDGLNIMLNEIVNHEMNKTLDEMIAVVEMWKQNTNTITCITVIDLLKSKKAHKNAVLSEGYMENIIRARIAELEKQLEKTKKKVVLGSHDVIKWATEVEKINYAITQLYICLGSKQKSDFK